MAALRQQALLLQEAPLRQLLPSLQRAPHLLRLLPLLPQEPPELLLQPLLPLLQAAAHQLLQVLLSPLGHLPQLQLHLRLDPALLPLPPQLMGETALRHLRPPQQQGALHPLQHLLPLVDRARQQHLQQHLQPVSPPLLLQVQPRVRQEARLLPQHPQQHPLQRPQQVQQLLLHLPLVPALPLLPHPLPRHQPPLLLLLHRAATKNVHARQPLLPPLPYRDDVVLELRQCNACGTFVAGDYHIQYDRPFHRYSDQTMTLPCVGCHNFRCKISSSCFGVIVSFKKIRQQNWHQLS